MWINRFSKVLFNLTTSSKVKPYTIKCKPLFLFNQQPILNSKPLGVNKWFILLGIIFYLLNYKIILYN